MPSSKQNHLSLKLSILGGKLEDSYEVTYNFPKDPLNTLVVNRSMKGTGGQEIRKFEIPLEEKDRTKVIKLFLDAFAHFQLNEVKDQIMDGISVSLYIGGQSNSVNVKYYDLSAIAEAGEDIDKLMKFVVNRIADRTEKVA
jgi:RNA binding exosome subunit